jgi:prevent-host-death family protein
MTNWSLQDAKAKFSKVVDESIAEGPQMVTRHGVPTAVVLSVADFERLQKKQPDFKLFLRRGRLHDLDLTRAGDAGRKVDL